MRHLIIVLGDQLNHDSSAFDGFDPAQDCVWMAEVDEESTHVWSSKQRITLFLSAMRHFADALRDKGYALDYHTLNLHSNVALNAIAATTDNNAHAAKPASLSSQAPSTLAAVLAQSIARHRPTGLILCAPGDWRVLQALRGVANCAAVPLELRDDRHFYTTVRDFAAHAKGRKQLRLEYFYRELRQKTGVLMQAPSADSTQSAQPLGGQWNFDADNREAFDKKRGPPPVPPPTHFSPDNTTLAVMAFVNTRFASHPGTVESFAWAVTRAQALAVLNDFVRERLPRFGQYQDALWQGEAWLYHSHLSSALNLKLLNPREVIDAAIKAYESGAAPLAAVEGFIRQILGWREYVRGIYWTQMPAYAALNTQAATAPLPAFYWTGDTAMVCLQDAISQSLKHGYAHHIQRLMVTGLYALLLGVNPKAVHEWYLSVYVDAVEWVELPNTIGMSQFADGGLMASKPYIASGKYIDRMSNYCQSCRYNPALSVDKNGELACPYTTLYWNYLSQHEPMLSKNPRMAMQLKNLRRLSPEQKAAIALQAQQHRNSVLPATTPAT
jgi:deoxyribodipyrimidine photolyase-related protein